MLNKNCVLGFFLANLSLIAWYFGLQANYYVWSRPNDSNDDDNKNIASFGLLGFALQEDEEYTVKYTIQQEDLLTSTPLPLFRLGRYLYFFMSVGGLLQAHLLILSFCGKHAWMLLSNCPYTQKRFLAKVSFGLALMPMAILMILYQSPLCQLRPQDNEPPLVLQFLYDSTIRDSEPWYFATTAEWLPLLGTSELDGPGQQQDDYSEMEDGLERIASTTSSSSTSSLSSTYYDASTTPTTMLCTPTSASRLTDGGGGTQGLLLATMIWLFCSLCLLACSTTPRQQQQGYYKNKYAAATLTSEPLLDSPTRTLGWMAKLTVVMLFASVPYWLEAALVAMAPQPMPFSKTTTTTITTINDRFATTQLLGPKLFNPTQQITYSPSQHEWVDTAFEWATLLAWAPFAIHACLTLPMVLYERYRLANSISTTTTGTRCASIGWSVWMFLLVAIQILVAVVCIGLPLQVMSELTCFANLSRFPELQFERSDDNDNISIWMGTDIQYHSAMTISCWPTELGQIYMLGGGLLSLAHAILVVVYCIQYTQAQDMITTFAGIEEDSRCQQQSLLLSASSSLSSSKSQWRRQQGRFRDDDDQSMDSVDDHNMEEEDDELDDEESPRTTTSLVV